MVPGSSPNMAATCARIFSCRWICSFLICWAFMCFVFLHHALFSSAQLSPFFFRLVLLCITLFFSTLLFFVFIYLALLLFSNIFCSSVLLSSLQCFLMLFCTTCVYSALLCFLPYGFTRIFSCRWVWRVLLWFPVVCSTIGRHPLTIPTSALFYSVFF